MNQDYFNIPMINPAPQCTEDGELIFSVSDLARQAKQVLESQLGHIVVQGEVSNLTVTQKGHAYFTLKDKTAQVRCVFFSGRYAVQEQQVQTGSDLIVHGKASFYLTRGEFQLVVSKIETRGEGQLQKQFTQLKNKLQQAGLFDAAHKKPFPPFINTLAIVTSAQGAALQDVLAVLRKRFPLIKVKVFDSLVQGEYAPNQLIHAMQSAEQDNECEAILLTRGGGSLEDLWAFNDEHLAHCIYQCRKPTMSAVGHEIDFTIADFVADVRAPTPSAAAETIAPDQIKYFEQCHAHQARLQKIMSTKIQHCTLLWQSTQAKLIHPKQRLTQFQQHLYRHQDRLCNVIHRNLEVSIKCHDQLKNRLMSQFFTLKLDHFLRQIQIHQYKLVNSIQRTLTHHKNRLQNLEEKINIINPLQLLQRGYTITKDEQNNIITSAAITEKKRQIKTVFHDGEVISTINKNEK